MRKGLTLIELLIFVAVFSVVVVAFISVFIAMLNLQTSQTAASEVNQQGQFLLQQIQYYIESAHIVDMPQDVAENTLTVRESSPSQDPTSISGSLAFVQASSTVNGGYGNTTSTFDNPTTNGDLLIAICTGDVSSSFISDSGLNVWHTVISQSSPGSYIILAYAYNIIGQHKHQITCNNPTASYSYSAIFEYRGVLASSDPLDQIANATGTNGTGAMDSGFTATTTQADELLFGVGVSGTGCHNAPVAGSNYTTREANGDPLIDPTIVEDEIVSSTGRYHATATCNAPFMEWGMGVAMFKGAVASLPTNGSVYLTQGTGGTPQALTSNKVSVSNLAFTRHFNVGQTAGPFGNDSVSFAFTMSATSTNNKKYAQTFQSSATTFAPIGKIAMIQQTSTVSNNPSVASLAAKYITNNETSSLLIAVVANTTSSASVSIADSAGNTWNKIANVPYLSYNEEVNVFDAVNAKNSSNTVTATLGAGAGYASLSLYEYRGASTSSSFDASSSQLQPNTQIPSSGYANATSAVELLFGVNYDGNTAEIPIAGSGFVLETTSSVTHVFVEDTTQYVTDPVAAAWQYSGTAPSSSALIVTFK